MRALLPASLADLRVTPYCSLDIHRRDSLSLYAAEAAPILGGGGRLARIVTSLLAVLALCLFVLSSLDSFVFAVLALCVCFFVVSSLGSLQPELIFQSTLF